MAAVTRQQVRSGALLSVDPDPAWLGRRAAALATAFQAGWSLPLPQEPSPRSSGMSALVVNADVARRLGADVRRLRALGARLE